jgi:diguanylate cyclase (GGDEF)-like protein/PAS domain S-box-containing protein
MPRTPTKILLRTGFTTILGLMFLVATVSLSMLHTSSRNIEQLVHANNTKTNLIHQMRNAGRERTLSLQSMILLDDPFRQDDEWMRINANGAAFAAARMQLMETVLTPVERELLDNQAEATRIVGALHLQIADLIIAGDKTRAYRLLSDHALPLQNQVFVTLSRLLDIQTEQADQAVHRAQTNYRNTLIIILALMIGITGLGLLIARFVIRRSAETERRLQAATDHAQITLHSIGDAVITTDVDGHIEQMNPEAERLTGWRAAEAINMPADKVFTAAREQAKTDDINPVLLSLREQRVIVSEADVTLRNRDGRGFAVEYTVAPILDRTRAGAAGAILVFRDVTQLRLITSELAYQAKHDMLTGLMNRREFEQHLQHALAGTPARTEEPHWLCYMDLDQFKLINDTCGHLAGDELLKQMSRVLQAQIRETDRLARMGGDEFALLLSRCGTDAAAQIVERIRQAVIGMRFDWEDKSFNIGGSFGLVPITPDMGTLYELMSAADAACYVAKDEGRNRVHIHQGVDDAAALRTGEMRWVQRIKQALEENRLVLYHQPITALQGRVYEVHAEILVRMLGEDGGLVPPMEFIPAAERYNLMSDVDRWVVRATLDTLQANLLCAAPGTCTIAINLSAQSLCNDEFLPFILHELDRHAIDPCHLCFEITETCAIGNLARAMHFIATLRARGCRFALDDFGSGLSSFGYLKNLPVEYLKIDGSFVRDIEHDPMDLAMVEAINQIGHVAGMQTIAEYVENAAIRETLRRLGVDYAQGYGIARPEPLHALVQRFQPRRREA